MLKIENLSKKFKNKILFEDVNLEFHNGELIHLKGINGSGKSTLFKIICDILKPSSGKIYLNDNVNIGAVIENSGFIENETILYNLKYLYNLKNQFNEESVKKLCDYFKLDIYSKEKLKNYSIGMRQKVAIIQAVMEDQNLLLFDEPTRGLDEESVNNFFKLINKLKKQNKTIIIASHDLENLEKNIRFDKLLEIKNEKIILL